MSKHAYRPWMIACVLGLLTVTARAADEPASASFEVKGVKIHYLTAGKGEPVVLIHGLDSSALMNWKLPGIFDELAKDHRVIALDLPGHGQSDKPENDDAYGQQVVEDVVALMDHLKVGKAHVVGYSLGGIIAMKLMVDHPDRVISGMLGGMGWLREGSGLQKAWEMLPIHEGGRTPAEFVHSVGKLAVTEDQVKKIAVPVEIIIGDHDPMKRLYVTPLLQVRKDWLVVEVKDAGHITCVIKEQFRDEVAAWVKKNTKSN